MPVLTVPAGQRVTDPAVAAQTGRVFGAIASSLPDVRVADYRSTGNRQFVTSDGRTTFALVFTPASTSFTGGPAPTGAITPRPSGHPSGSQGSGSHRSGSHPSRSHRSRSHRSGGLSVGASLGPLKGRRNLGNRFGSRGFRVFC
jgi:hypothetical protein